MLASLHGVCVGVCLSALASSQWVQLRDREREVGKGWQTEGRKVRKGRKAGEREVRGTNGVEQERKV